MTTPKTLEDFGATFVDLGVMENPTGEMPAAKGNRLCEDVAQMTRMLRRARVSFVPVATGAPVAVVVASHKSLWGSGDTQKPTIQKTATGVYAITYAASLTDGLNESEELALERVRCSILHASTNYPDPRPQSVTANVVTIRVVNASFANTDITDATITVWVE